MSIHNICFHGQRKIFIVYHSYLDLWNRNNPAARGHIVVVVMVIQIHKSINE